MKLTVFIAGFLLGCFSMYLGTQATHKRLISTFRQHERRMITGYTACHLSTFREYADSNFPPDFRKPLGEEKSPDFHNHMEDYIIFYVNSDCFKTLNYILHGR